MGNDTNYLPPRVLQYIGIALLLASAAFWAVTDRQSVLLMSGAMTLISVGSYSGVRDALRKPGGPPPPEIAKPEEES